MRFALLVIVSAIACGRTTVPAPSADDSPRTLAGDWTLRFGLDSSRTQRSSWTRGSHQSVQGTLHLASSSGDVSSRIQVDFWPLVYRDMSCFAPRPRTTVITNSGENTTLLFTPEAVDCGFSASGKFYGDSLIGTWEETSFVGPVTAGYFQMIRAR